MVKRSAPRKESSGSDERRYRKHPREDREEWSEARDDSEERFGSRPGSYRRHERPTSAASRRQHDEYDDDGHDDPIDDHLSTQMERPFSQQRQEIRTTITDAVRNEISRELGGIREEMATLSANVGQVSSNHEAFEQRLAALETDRASRAFEAASGPPTSTPPSRHFGV